MPTWTGSRCPQSSLCRNGISKPIFFSDRETEAHKRQLKASGGESEDQGLGPRFDEI